MHSAGLFEDAEDIDRQGVDIAWHTGHTANLSIHTAVYLSYADNSPHVNKKGRKHQPRGVHTKVSCMSVSLRWVSVEDVTTPFKVPAAASMILTPWWEKPCAAGGQPRPPAPAYG